MERLEKDLHLESCNAFSEFNYIAATSFSLLRDQSWRKNAYTLRKNAVCVQMGSGGTGQGSSGVGLFRPSPSFAAACPSFPVLLRLKQAAGSHASKKARPAILLWGLPLPSDASPGSTAAQREPKAAQQQPLGSSR